MAAITAAEDAIIVELYSTVTLHRRGLWPAEKVVCGGGFAWMVRRADLSTFEYWHPPVHLEYAKGHCGALPRAGSVGFSETGLKLN